MPLYRFGAFEFDTATGELRGTGCRVRLRPQPARALEHLLERHGEFVSRGELQRAIWPDGTFVHFDYGLNSCLKQIRAALGDSRSAPTYIETLVKRGFRFIAPVSVVDTLSSPESELCIVAARPERVEHRRRKGVVVNALRLSLYVIIPASVGILASAGGRSQTPPRQEYRGTAWQEKLLQSDLVAVPGKQATVLSLKLPAGWVGEAHYHSSDVLVYVLDGELTVDVEGQARKTFGAGEVCHMAVNTVMTARNPSTKRSTQLILFQVGGKGEPLMIPGKPKD
jgi:DNA-binding winged helix-turn-helix (wHTH) protein/quercetin dioxygenase-like cupin family protein